jgi:hypothetical protein
MDDSSSRSRYWLYGAAVFVAFVFISTVVLWEFFSLAFWQPIIAIILSMPLAYLGTRLALIGSIFCLGIHLS